MRFKPPKNTLFLVFDELTFFFVPFIVALLVSLGFLFVLHTMLFDGVSFSLFVMFEYFVANFADWGH